MISSDGENMVLKRLDLEIADRFKYLYKWNDYAKNPILEATISGDWVADPTLVLSKDSPDGLWHMFCCGKTGIKHYTSTDGLLWDYSCHVDAEGYSPYIFVENDAFYLFYQKGRLGHEVYIVCRVSRDLKNWEDPFIVLKGDLSWETGVKGESYVRNPCIIRLFDKYLLYYSAGYTLLPDTGYDEPTFIGVATSTNITGPYIKSGTPIMKPDPLDPWRNMGAGAMKVYCYGNMLLGFENGIYIGSDGHTHSALHLLISTDGFNWIDSPYNPILKPGFPEWKKAFVYQCDVKRLNDVLYLYYNSRDGWREGVERIGLATCTLRT